MKKFILCIMAVAVAFGGYAKERGSGIILGVKAGVNASSFLMSKVQVDGINNKMRVGFTVGVTAERPVSSFLSLEADLMFSLQGGKTIWDNAGPNVEFGTAVYNINIPITANFHIVKGLSVKAGLQPGFKVGAKFRGDSPLSELENAGSYFNRFDLSVPVGLSYDFSMFRIEARYAVGVTNVFRGIPRILGEARNSVVSVTFGVKF